MKQIKGHERLYSITKDGKVWSHERIIRGRKYGGNWLSPKNSNGYLHVILCKKGIMKTKLIHRLVGQTFIPNLDNKPCINHKDGNKLNNDITNLEWVTYSENDLHAFKIGLKSQKGENNTRSKLTEDQVREIRRNHVPIKSFQEKVYKKYNIRFQTYYRIVNGTRWNHIKEEK